MIDPVDHYGQSPYNGYDSNPVFFADPSGANTSFEHWMQGVEEDWDAIDRGANPFDVFRSRIDTDHQWAMHNKQQINVLIDALTGLLGARGPQAARGTNVEVGPAAYGGIIPGVNLIIVNSASPGDVGHTAISIGDTVFGYYPSEENGKPGYQKGDLASSQGRVVIQSLESFMTHYSSEGFTMYELDMTPDQTSTLFTSLNNWACYPGNYSLTGNQCTTVAVSALKSVGIRFWNCVEFFPFRGYEHLDIRLSSPFSLQRALNNPINSYIIKQVTTY